MVRIPPLRIQQSNSPVWREVLASPGVERTAFAAGRCRTRRHSANTWALVEWFGLRCVWITIHIWTSLRCVWSQFTCDRWWIKLSRSLMIQRCCSHPEGPRSTGSGPGVSSDGGRPTLARRPCRNSAVQDRNSGIPEPPNLTHYQMLGQRAALCASFSRIRCDTTRHSVRALLWIVRCSKLLWSHYLVISTPKFTLLL